MKCLLSGNEAIARGAYEAGAALVVGYPGTPSTEIVETAAKYDDLLVEWAPNEKVALEVAIGGSLGGARTMACMKHVGVNVAADPLMTAAYLGLRGGLVLVSADDPGAWSSQNEQDNRNYARFAKIPLLEPSDSAECLEFTRAGFEISEMFGTPVFLRTTTRVSHTRTVVSTSERTAKSDGGPIDFNVEETVMVPAFARKRHLVLERRLKELESYADTCDLNRIEQGDGDTGFITSGISYQYVKEAFPTAPVLKLGMAWPLSRSLIERFASGVRRVIVVEELDPFLETEIKAMGIPVGGKNLLPTCGELSAQLLKFAVTGETAQAPAPVPDLPARGPVLCPGCPHRGVFYILRKLKATVMGDIGCYTLGVNPPLSAIHGCTCMGAGIGQAHGLLRTVGAEKASRIVAVIGDSTFFHSGMTGLLNSVYNQAPLKLVILDNGTTAMTGHQGHAGTGLNAKGEESPRALLENVVAALGAARVWVVDPYDLDGTENALRELLAAERPSVVIARRLCALLKGVERKPPLSVEEALCRSCNACLRLGCPAITLEGKKARIDSSLCNGCGLCAQVCKFDAITASSGEGGAA